MAKKLSLNAVKEFTAQHSGAAYVGLLTVMPADGGPWVRLCTDPLSRLSVDPLRYGFVSRGQIFDYLPMRAKLPGSNMSALPATSIETDNIDASVVDAVKSSIYRASLLIETVFSTRPNDVVEEYPDMEVVDATWNDDTVTLTVGYQSLETTPLTRHRLTVGVCPALRNVSQG